jgi:hypothetical protein
MVWVLTSTQDEVPEFRTRDLNEVGVSDAYLSCEIAKNEKPEDFPSDPNI